MKYFHLRMIGLNMTEYDRYSPGFKTAHVCKKYLKAGFEHNRSRKTALFSEHISGDKNLNIVLCQMEAIVHTMIEWPSFTWAL